MIMATLPAKALEEMTFFFRAPHGDPVSHKGDKQYSIRWCGVGFYHFMCVSLIFGNPKFLGVPILRKLMGDSLFCIKMHYALYH